MHLSYKYPKSPAKFFVAKLLRSSSISANAVLLHCCISKSTAVVGDVLLQQLDLTPAILGDIITIPRARNTVRGCPWRRDVGSDMSYTYILL